MIGPDLEGPIRKITQYMGQQLPEQSGGGCSDI